MGVNIGDINIPFVSTFSVDKSSKPTEQIKHLGNVPPHVAEFQADVLKFIMDGTLFQASGDVRDVDQYAEDITALVERFGVYNSIYDYQGRSGWLIIDSGDSDKSANSVLIRDYSLGGRFMPKNKYQARMHTAPVILTNDFSLTLGAGGCDNYVPIPIGATFSGGDNATITRTGQDGAVTLVKATTNKDVTWDLAADEVDVGECKVFDDMNEVAEADWVRVFNLDHVFIGKVIIENGLARIKQSSNNKQSIYFYNGATWATGHTWNNIDQMGTLQITSFSEINPEKIVMKERYITTPGGAVPELVVLETTIYRGRYDIYREITEFNNENAGNWWASQDSARFYIGNGNTLLYDGLLEGAGILNPAWTNDNYRLAFDLDIAALYIEIHKTTTALDYGAYSYGTGVDLTIGYSFGGNLATNDMPCWRVNLPFANIANLFKECEAMTQGAGVAYYTGADASPTTGNTGSILNAQNENVYYEFTGGTDLPLGTYKLFMRAKDSAQVANDISCLVRNTTDSTDVMAETTKTLTGSWAYYSFDVTIASDDDTDTIRVTLNKETATANTIDLDYVLWVPITLESGNGPQDIAHQAMCDSKLQRELVAR